MLDRLKAKLVEGEQQYREQAFRQAHAFLERAAVNGGVPAPYKKSYPSPSRADGRRVDIEVLKGLAFVPAAWSAR